MFSRKKRQRFHPAVLLTATALLLPNAFAHADSYNGTRYDGSNFNGYWIAPSALPYAQTIRSAYDVWIQACSSTGLPKLITLGQRLANRSQSPTPYQRGQDVLSFKPLPGEQNADESQLGWTVFFKLDSSGKAVLDTDPMVRDKDWLYCKITIDYAVLDSNATATGADSYLVLLGVLVHEIGHTLKFTHPPQGLPGQAYVAGQPGNLPGDGTFKDPSGNKTRSFGEGYSVMIRQNSGHTLSPYDISELKLRWGK